MINEIVKDVENSTDLDRFVWRHMEKRENFRFVEKIK